MDTPAVTIGMPVHNEAAYLRESLDCLLGQDYREFELVITDNASTDETEQICRAYADHDPRIRYHRNTENLGAARNFWQAFELARGRYFMWNSGHDLRSHGYLASCVKVLEQDPSVVLCTGMDAAIDRSGQVLSTLPPGSDTRRLRDDPVGRVMLSLWSGHQAQAIYGVIRASVLREEVTGIKQVYGCDDLILLRLSLRGCIARVADQFYYSRIVREEGGLEAAIKRWSTTLCGPGVGPRRWFAFWGFAFESLRIALRAKLPVGKKLMLLGGVLLWLGKVRKFLLKELLYLGRI